MALEDSSQPRLATGCRWAGDGEKGTILFPEGALRLQETARAILQLCDGERTLLQIVQELEAAYSGSEPGKIRKDTVAFLEHLWQRRVVDF